MSLKIKYLYDNPQIANVLAEGFAKICQQKPQFPINYLARYLKNHTTKKNEKSSLIDRLQSNSNIIEQIQQRQAKYQQQIVQLTQQQKLKKLEQDSFLNKISSTQRHQQILDYFCQWVTDKLKVTAVYIGELENQTKKVNLLEQDGEEAHLELEKQKIIKFKYASSDQQKKIVLNKILTQESVVGKLINQASASGQQNQAEQQQNQQNQQQSTTKKLPKIKGQIYIPSVVGNQQLKFFKFPKLGSYFATALTIKCYLKQKLFDQNTSKVQNYKKVLADFQKQIQEKQAKFKQSYDQKMNAGAEEKQLEDMEAEFEKQKSAIVKPVRQQFSYYQRKFIVCMDTLGLDREISEQQKQRFRSFVAHLKNSWQSSQLKQLQHDIQHQLSLLKPHAQQGHQAIQPPNFPQQFTTLIQQQQKQIPSHQQVQKVKDNEKLLELESNTLRFEKVKEYLVEEKNLVLLDHLLNFNVIKYHQIVKQWLIVLGWKKEEFCFKGTNLLDWQKTKFLLNSQRTTLFEQLNGLNPRGAKPEFILQYAKCARIQKALQGLDAVTVAGYNLYLAFLLRLLQLYTKTRLQDRQARLTKIQLQRQNRQQKIKQAEQKTRQKAEKLESIKAELQQKGQLQTFDEQAWSLQYDEQNPAIEIPDEIPNDIDRDIEDVAGGENVQVINEENNTGQSS